MGTTLFTLLLCYLAGAIPSSVWFGKLAYGKDVRDSGSGNAGATNTFRVLGWKAGTVVLLFDFFKGLAATLFISQLAYGWGGGHEAVSSSLGLSWFTETDFLIWCGLMAVIGHMFPVYIGFRGGKGAATACGMLYGIEPISISIALSIFLIVLFTSRYVSLASISSSAAYPFAQLALIYLFGVEIETSFFLFSSVIALMIILKHKSNIGRLLNGTERRVGSFKPGRGSGGDGSEGTGGTGAGSAGAGSAGAGSVGAGSAGAGSEGAKESGGTG